MFSESLRGSVKRFHDVYVSGLLMRPRLSIKYYYSSLGEHIHPQVQARADLLKAKCQTLFSAATVEVRFLGAAGLLALYNRMPTKTLSMHTAKSMGLSSFGTAFVCLVPLHKFFDFITDEKGTLREHIFEANVRDYQGDVQVNKAIATTLSEVGAEEFWWLNNGITILASEARLDGDIMTITDPLIVNGLQSSYEIFLHFKLSPGDDKRTILVRVIQSTEPTSVDNIINATNSQTTIPRIWLHATEPIHRKIELALHTVGLYYDRRKNHYRNMGAPSSKIVTLPYLSQAIAAIVLQRPDDARARPTTVADRHYKLMYSEAFPIELYSKCALLAKQVDDYLDGFELDSNAKNNVRYHVAMYAVCLALNSAKPNRGRIAALNMEDVTDDILRESLGRVWTCFGKLGAGDRVAKGTTFTEELKAELKGRFAKEPISPGPLFDVVTAIAVVEEPENEPEVW